MRDEHNGISGLRCFNHRNREAVAKCLECGRYFCRECVTEHEERLLCASCLKKHSKPPLLRRIRLAAIGSVFQGLAGLLLAWLVFYYLGQGLLLLPNSFHEGTVWEEGLDDGS